MKKVMIVFGTRPEGIKMAPVCHAFSADENIESVVCVTGQHREMLDQVLNIFDIEPDIDLNVMGKGQDLFDLTSRIMIGMREALYSVKPDVVLVHGDTTTTMACSIAAFYAGVPVAHVEAGLRTYDLYAPFPEEFNRRSAGLIAQYHFAPTNLSQSNLLAEGVTETNIWVTGNTVIDSLQWVLNNIEKNPSLQAEISSNLKSILGFDVIEGDYVLITGHRRENFGQGFLNICEAIKTLANKHPGMNFVYPVHLNPNVQNPVNKLLGSLNNVRLIPPQEYQPFVTLLKNCYLVLTDSGGIQEEAPSLGKPVLVMRDVTERPEAVEAGTVRIIGAASEQIISHVDDLICNREMYNKMSAAINPYGDGKAAARILKVIKDTLYA